MSGPEIILQSTCKSDFTASFGSVITWRQIDSLETATSPQRKHYVGGNTYAKQQMTTFFLMKEQRRSRAVELQQEFYCTCIYDLLKNFADPPTSVSKLKFYQWKIQHLQTQTAIRTYVSHRNESHSKWNLNFSPNQSTQTQTSTDNHDNP